MDKNINTIEKSLNIYDRIKSEIIKFINLIKTKFYKVNLKEFTLASITLPETEETYPIILKLIKRNILKNMTDLEKLIVMMAME